MPHIEGLAAHAAGAELLPYHYDPGKLGSHDVEIVVTHCGVCHSDLHLISNDRGISQYPFIPGHEAIGTVAAFGSDVRSAKVGQRVGLGWQSNSCGICEWCRKGMENLCPESEATCVRRNGGFANRVRANSRFVFPIPDALPSEQAAPLLCAGITVYSPLRIYGINPSSRVGIIGVGGLGHLAIQFARAFGAEVTAFSTSSDKEEEVRALGAHRFVNSRESKALKEVAGTQDFILSTINADQDWGVYIQALRPTGTLCFVGSPPAQISIQALPLITGQRAIAGNPVGSPWRIREMLDVAARHDVRAITQCFPMAKANEAIDQVKKGKIRYRAVLAN